MKYDRELQFLQNILQKCRMSTIVEELSQLRRGMVDGRPIRREEELFRLMRENIDYLRPKTLFRYTDPYFCSYMCLALDEERVLILGPYLTVAVGREEVMKLAEELRLPGEHLRTLAQYYQSVPHLPAGSGALAAVDTFCELLWGSDYATVDVNREMAEMKHPYSAVEVSAAMVEDPQRTMRMMEQRYAYENELMQAVSMGLSHKVEHILGNLSVMGFERRSADPVRNLKNYCIIMNTLLRKAAEDGGVHPYYLDRASSEFALRIEAVTSVGEAEKLMKEMFLSYCRLVKKNSVKQYSPVIQRAIVQIDTDLAGDLSLKHLAQLQNINASYLSTLFKRETGQTVTDFVNGRRVQLARQLLATTQLQIQTIARYCGISDVNYFSKIFKKHTGKSPKEYRRELSVQS